MRTATFGTRLNHWGTLAALMTCGACATVEGSGHVVSEERPIANFDRVTLKDQGTIDFTQADKVELVVEAEDNIVDEFKARVNDGKLVIEQRRDVWLRPTTPIRFHLSGPALRRVELDGSGRFHSERLETPSLFIDVDGSGKVKLDSLQADTLQVKVEGSGDLTLVGEVISQNVDISGSADYRAGNLESAHATIDVSGSADATLFVTDELVVDIEGSGAVYYRGDPRVRSDIDGSGKLRAIE